MINVGSGAVEEDVMVWRGRQGNAASVAGVLSARGAGRGAIVGVRPPLGGHVLQRAIRCVGGGLNMLVPNVGQIYINHHRAVEGPLGEGSEVAPTIGAGALVGATSPGCHGYPGTIIFFCIQFKKTNT